MDALKSIVEMAKGGWLDTREILNSEQRRGREVNTAVFLTAY